MSHAHEVQRELPQRPCLVHDPQRVCQDLLYPWQ